MIMLLLFSAGLFAGTVDAIAGGGGLISLPILLSIGMPPHVAFGTNKLQGTIGTLAATIKFHRHGFISLHTIYKGLIFGLIGSILGSIISQLVSADFLRIIIPILLLVIIIYTLLTPKLGIIDKKPIMNEPLFYLIFGFGLGIYDGFFGPGTGSFWIFVLTLFLGYNLIKATAYTKVFNLNSSLVATICFAIGGNIDYRLGLCMAAGQLIGGRLGAHIAIKKGAQFIRPLFLIVVSSTMAMLLYKSYASIELLSHVSKLYRSPLMLIILLMLMAIFLYKLSIKKT